MVFRLILVFALIVLAGLALAWMFTREGKYLRIAGGILRFLLVLVVVIALVFVAERLVLR